MQCKSLVIRFNLEKCSPRLSEGKFKRNPSIVCSDQHKQLWITGGLDNFEGEKERQHTKTLTANRPTQLVIFKRCSAFISLLLIECYCKMAENPDYVHRPRPGGLGASVLDKVFSILSYHLIQFSKHQNLTMKRRTICWNGSRVLQKRNLTLPEQGTISKMF